MNPNFYEIYDAEAIEVIKTMSKKCHEAIASLYLEGTALLTGTLKDLKLAEEGKLTKEEYMARLIARAQS